MKIIDKVIIECTEQELIDNWISSGYMDVMPFSEYKMKCELLGTKIVQDIIYKNPLPSIVRYKPTNADKIRAMSDEELAEFILQIASCDKESVLCDPTEYKYSGKCNGRCREGRLDWLKQATKEDL